MIWRGFWGGVWWVMEFIARHSSIRFNCAAWVFNQRMEKHKPKMLKKPRGNCDEL